MGERDDGGPAFPSHGTMGEVVQEGMSLRDYFAASAVSELLDQVSASTEEAVMAKVAVIAYKMADFMLEARKR